MTIDEVIALLNEKLSCDYNISGCARCDISSCTEKDLYEQIAEWLEELQEYKGSGLTPQMIKELKRSEVQAHKNAIQNAMIAEDSYKKAIDDFLHTAEIKIADMILKHQDQINFASGLACSNHLLDEIADQLKAGK